MRAQRERREKHPIRPARGRGGAAAAVPAAACDANATRTRREGARRPAASRAREAWFGVSGLFFSWSVIYGEFRNISSMHLMDIPRREGIRSSVLLPLAEVTRRKAHEEEAASALGRMAHQCGNLWRIVLIDARDIRIHLCLREATDLIVEKE